ncbi:MAG: glycerophosphodiester phosphodiesterase [Bacilli bacterium]|nr:glycerophosphodiester phosphodiesterase [Bacilli bacterium]
MLQPIEVKLQSPTRIIAHRGLSGIAPENTLPAFIEAGKHGYYGTECDFHVTKDGQFAVFHDSTLDRMTNGQGYIKDYTYEELLNFTIDAGNNIESYPGLKIPLLEEYIDVCIKYDMVPVIEVKSVHDNTDLDRFIDLLKAKGIFNKVHVISFVLDYLLYLRSKEPELTIFYLVEHITDEVLNICINNNLHIDALVKYLSPEIIQACKNSNILLNTYTVDYKEIAELLNLHKIDFITSNILIESK